jgi:hypothetical protein
MRPLKGYQLAVCVSKQTGLRAARKQHGCGGHSIVRDRRERRWEPERSQNVAEFCAILDEGRGVAGNNN